MVRVTKLELHRTITDIMKKEDLDKLTTKKIRILCEEKYNIDLTSRKREIDAIVMAFIRKYNSVHLNKDLSDARSSSYESDTSTDCSSESKSCSDSECSYSGSSDEEPVPKNEAASKVASKTANAKKAPVKRKAVPVKKSIPTKLEIDTKQTSKKKTKKNETVKQIELDDAAYARKLQAEEWNFRQRTVNKLFRDSPKRKNDNEQPKNKKACPFLRKCLLSPALAEVIGTNEMSRPDIVQKMCSIFRERSLFDPSNKQYALCDEQLMNIFGKKRIRVIGMMKYLKHHIKDIN